MKLVKAVGVTLAVVTVAHLTGVNALHPWQGIRFTPASDLDLGIAPGLVVASTCVCIWRLIKGAKPGAELRRVMGAHGGQGRFELISGITVR